MCSVIIPCTLCTDVRPEHIAYTAGLCLLRGTFVYSCVLVEGWLTRKRPALGGGKLKRS